MRKNLPVRLIKAAGPLNTIFASNRFTNEVKKKSSLEKLVDTKGMPKYSKMTTKSWRHLFLNRMVM